jgi:hypothetical protein
MNVIMKARRVHQIRNLHIFTTFILIYI